MQKVSTHCHINITAEIKSDGGAVENKENANSDCEYRQHRLGVKSNGKDSTSTHLYLTDNNLVITMSAKKSGTKKRPKPKVEKIDETKDQGAETEETGREDAPQTDPNTESVAVVEAQAMDAECSYCKGPIYTGRAIKCECGTIVHTFCFNSHGMSKHQPKYTVVEVITKSVHDNTGAYKGQKATYSESANV